MNKKEQASRDIEINLLPILKLVVSRIWLMVLVGLVVAGTVFAATKLLIKPTYRSSFTAYVNNQHAQESKDTLTYNDLSAAKQLVSTYKQIIRSNQILSAAAQSINLDMEYRQLNSMVTADVQDDTEIIVVSVTTTDPQLSYDFANAISQVAPSHMSEIVEGSSMKIIDSPMLNTARYSPSYVRYALLGFLAGVLIILIKTLIDYFRDDKVKSEQEIEERFEIPILGVIPDIENVKSSAKGYEYNYAYKASDRKEG